MYATECERNLVMSDRILEREWEVSYKFKKNFLFNKVHNFL